MPHFFEVCLMVRQHFLFIFSIPKFNKDII